MAVQQTMDAAHQLTDRDTAASDRPHTLAARPGWLDRQLAAHIQHVIERACVRLELWDGSTTYGGADPPIGDLLIRDRGTLVGLLFRPDLWFGEAYVTGRLEVRGPLEPVLEALSRLTPAEPSWLERVQMALARANSIGASRHNVHHHYDLGNAFYQLWLDRELVYTCAYYADPGMSLDDAQVAKLDLVCRKLRLRPGESVVEAGCGWGSLALHMARKYGVRVRAFNLSREQLDYARARALREGLSDRVEFVDDDYRNLRGAFDVFVSVGMLEHVGLRHFRSLADVLRRSLRRDGGRGLLHFIGRDVARPVNAWTRKRIFPGGYVPTLAQVTTRILGPAGMSLVDVENLRLHYKRTLAHWSQRFAAVRDQVQQTYGEQFCRAWALYLAGSEAAFATSHMQLFQVLFVPRESPPPSWTRRDPFTAPGLPT
jgi:cyclopropane-fatty-acyl-phospholipid synthase